MALSSGAVSTDIAHYACHSLSLFSVFLAVTVPLLCIYLFSEVILSNYDNGKITALHVDIAEFVD